MNGRKTSEDGAVTPFLILVFAVIFAFVAVFADTARIAALHVQTDRLTHAAVRSVMSSFDPVLQQQYALFALGEGAGQEIMTKVLNDSDQLNTRDGNISILTGQVDSSTLTKDRKLGRYMIFNHQVQEEMKYKAPVDFAFEILDRFKPLSRDMKEASHTVDLMKKLQKLYDEREQKLDEALENRRKAASGISKIPGLLGNDSAEVIGDQRLGGSIRSAADSAAMYEDYQLKVNEDALREPKDKQYNDELQRYRLGTGIILTRIQQESQQAVKEHAELLAKSRSLIHEASMLNEQMKGVIEESRQRNANQGYDTVGSASTPNQKASSSEGTAGQSRARAEELLLPESIFIMLETGISEQEKDHAANGQLLMSARSSMQSAVSAGTTSAEYKQSVRSAYHAVKTYEQRYLDSGSSNEINREQEALEERRGSDKERKSLEKQAGAKLKQAYQVLDMLRKGQESSAQFEQLKQYYEESLAYNQSSNEEVSAGTAASDPYEAGGNAMQGMDGMYAAAASLMGQLSDEFFQNEYALMYFNHVDFGKLGGLSAGSGGFKGQMAEVLGDQLLVNNQEVEYILYGLHNPTGNLAAAYGEIFGMRLAIRTMEGLIKNSSKGNPLLVLAAAVLYGVEKAIEDMVELAQKGAIQLSEYVPVRMTYADHLRLFLMLHSHNEHKMSRMLALIRLNTGINPAERDTYASGEVKRGMRLWFLPGVMGTLGIGTGSGGVYENGRYYVTKQADFSY
ncbi:DUF5702 domain-containing protein [Paenibacillus sp. JX-17]|uniref:DUF5702 domain-containing protein n=1 Tax=Paenibacillus lacisoli TaxID=3064525 RepID=A0ABT9CFF0_9BACL|nr:DUF5702 domain-containing protein [Paenibacillus sp. JX-17]MDO7907298.1 DUF5702 domain-containing protein [Paenibacillus sp. JX-17]